MPWKQHVAEPRAWAEEAMRRVTSLDKLPTNLERALASGRMVADVRYRTVMRARAPASADRRLDDFDVPEGEAWVHSSREIAGGLVDVFRRTVSSVPGSLIERQ